jgi:6-phosphogluconolactonase
MSMVVVDAAARSRARRTASNASSDTNAFDDDDERDEREVTTTTTTTRDADDDDDVAAFDGAFDDDARGVRGAASPTECVMYVSSYTNVDILAHQPARHARHGVGKTTTTTSSSTTSVGGGGNRGADVRAKAVEMAIPTIDGEWDDHGGDENASSGDRGQRRGVAAVHVVGVCERTGRARVLRAKAARRGGLENVAFFAKHPHLPHVAYASTERIDERGKVLALRLIGDDGADFEVVGEACSGGKSTCYMGFDRDGKHLLAASYWDAKLSVIPLQENGATMHAPTLTISRPEADYVEHAKPSMEEHWRFRQRWAHTHCVVTEPYERRLHFVVDLGLDKIFIYNVESMQCVSEVVLPKGKGPRHLVFHPTIRAAYLVNELDSTVSSFRVCLDDIDNPRLSLMQCVGSLPEDVQAKKVFDPRGAWKAHSHSSEIRLHPSGRFLLVGNRGHDSIAVYAINQDDGLITLVDIVASGGACPRNFNFTPSGKFVLVGNQNSHNLASFSFCEHTGRMSMVHCLTDIVSPNFIWTLPKVR